MSAEQEASGRGALCAVMQQGSCEWASEQLRVQECRPAEHEAVTPGLLTISKEHAVCARVHGAVDQPLAGQLIHLPAVCMGPKNLHQQHVFRALGSCRTGTTKWRTLLRHVPKHTLQPPPCQTASSWPLLPWAPCQRFCARSCHLYPTLPALLPPGQ